LSSGRPHVHPVERRDAHRAIDPALERYITEVEGLRTRSALALSLALLSQRRGEGEQSWKTVMSEMQKVRDGFIRSFERFQSEETGRPDDGPRGSAP
jgi:hypothetical protein